MGGWQKRDGTGFVVVPSKSLILASPRTNYMQILIVRQYPLLLQIQNKFRVARHKVYMCTHHHTNHNYAL